MEINERKITEGLYKREKESVFVRAWLAFALFWNRRRV